MIPISQEIDDAKHRDDERHADRHEALLRYMPYVHQHPQNADDDSHQTAHRFPIHKNLQGSNAAQKSVELRKRLR